LAGGKANVLSSGGLRFKSIDCLQWRNESEEGS